MISRVKGKQSLKFPDSALIRRQAKELLEMEQMPLADFLKLPFVQARITPISDDLKEIKHG